MLRFLGLLLFVCSPGAVALAAVQEPAGGFDVLAYRLQLAPDLQQQTVSGTEWVRLRVTADTLSDIVFTPNPMVVDGVTAQGGVVRAETASNPKRFHLETPLPRGSVLTLQIRYHGAPKQGVTFQPDSLVTSYFACEWMFCTEDAPGDKATFDLELHVPSGLTSLAVGQRMRVRRLADGSELHRWRVRVPYSAYVYDFAIGRFTTVTVPLGHHQELAYVGAGVSADELQRLFAETPAMVAFLAEKAGAPLPLRSYGQLLVPGAEAQETASYSILGRDNLTPDNDWATIHELAHQWWGNWVTCRTWQDFWLNEGFAVYLTAVWKQHAHGQPAYDQEMGEARKRMERLRAAAFDRPLAWPGEYPKLWMRRTVQYSKGALFLEALHAEMGDAAFWTGVRDYTRAHGGGTVVSAEFEQSMQRASAHDLKPLFQTWVYGDASTPQ